MRPLRGNAVTTCWHSSSTLYGSRGRPSKVAPLTMNRYMRSNRVDYAGGAGLAYPVLTGAVLIEANGAALNNEGQDEGIRADNAIVVKQIRNGRVRYPYVSGQAWRRWWREVLYADFGWKPSEVIRERKSAYTSGDPVQYEEDDLFGYMAARKRGQGQGTLRRISPLKNSLLISVLPNVIDRGFGHFSRNLPAGADFLLFESAHYTTYLQGAFTVS